MITLEGKKAIVLKGIKDNNRWRVSWSPSIKSLSLHWTLNLFQWTMTSRFFFFFFWFHNFPRNNNENSLLKITLITRFLWKYDINYYPINSADLITVNLITVNLIIVNLNYGIMNNH